MFEVPLGRGFPVLLSHPLVQLMTQQGEIVDFPALPTPQPATAAGAGVCHHLPSGAQWQGVGAEGEPRGLDLHHLVRRGRCTQQLPHMSRHQAPGLRVLRAGLL